MARHAVSAGSHHRLGMRIWLMLAVAATAAALFVDGVGAKSAMGTTLRGQLKRAIARGQPSSQEQSVLLLHSYLDDAQSEASLDSKLLDEQIATQERNHTVYMAVSERVAAHLRSQLAMLKPVAQWKREVSLSEALINNTAQKLNRTSSEAESLQKSALSSEMELAHTQQQCLERSRRRAKILNSLSRMLATQRRKSQATTNTGFLEIRNQVLNVTAPATKEESLPTPLELKEAFANIIEAVEENRELAANKCEDTVTQLRSTYASSSTGAHRARAEVSLIARDLNELKDMHVHLLRRMRMDDMRRNFLKSELNRTVVRAENAAKVHTQLMTKMKESLQQAGLQLDSVAKLKKAVSNHADELLAELKQHTEQ